MYKFVAGRKFNILVVDDENVIADTIAIGFSNDGYDAGAAYSAEHANSLTPEWIPDFAIIDGCLPDTSGINFAIKLKIAYPASHIILFQGRLIRRLCQEHPNKSGTILRFTQNQHPLTLCSISSEACSFRTRIVEQNSGEFFG